MLLNTKNISILEETGELCIIKYTSKNNFNNYFFGPNISIQLWSPKVSWMDNNSLSFQFEKNDNLNMLTLLRDINTKLISLYSAYKESRGHQELQTKPCIFFEKDTHFYIKCNLPNSNGRYHITCKDDSKFVKPRLGQVYQIAVLDIRNIWEMIGQNKIGFRLELKHVSV
jgi:hypothetical protein